VNEDAPASGTSSGKKEKKTKNGKESPNLGRALARELTLDGFYDGGLKMREEEDTRKRAAPLSCFAF